ncbi:aspartyl/glutamyl-tRNA(Asn/Gln) amidotransferase subunit B [Methanobrevibacter cuticularis]|uniref:Glutamyl-tRNA(Gln) amidotransferase subunit E n=1 Tax=Methanobrevibacter cuticularis TaxID=47311 RepID=A0A166CRS3_9EURY|nr:Glu-tRNA(Gln) amidotransferase subunit GatE [Methanobrevibacter cuticularis]KZX16317.1 aspartyl/glutamyl-tRNA(Asn/Gln) amidotransferase subunit B [Methanobrevibacter cuticularis]
MDWDDLGLKMGLEIHQQLNTETKLFCPCATELIDERFDNEIKRGLRPTQSELGQIDRAAFQESMRKLKFNYEAYNHRTCLVETDDEPPHDLNEEALDLAITIASLLNMHIIDEVHTMRKQVIDGSNTGGFQRTSLVATDGYLETPQGKVAIENLCLEEDACRRIATENDFTHFRLDRLGIPLVEITTDPSIHHPEQVKEVAYVLGQILRSTNVKRGLGTIRQDLNISIAKGSRVELKGVQNLDLIPEMVELEVQRQLNLLNIQEELKSRDARVLDDIHDLDEIFKNTSSKILSTAQSIKGIVLKGFKGLVGLEIQKGRRFGTELSSYAKKREVSGIFHTDELPAYGISQEETESMRSYLNADEDDTIVIVAHDEDIAISALEEVIRRANMAFDGVPEETRKALEDGTSEFMRPLPTANRMYLETDIPLFKIDKNKIINIRNNLPELPEEKKNRIIDEYSLSEDLAKQLVKKLHADEFEIIMKEIDVDSTLVASFLAYNLREIKREGIVIKHINPKDLIATFKLLSAEKISKDAITDIIKEIAINKEAIEQQFNEKENGFIKYVDKDIDNNIDPEQIAKSLDLLLLGENDVENIIIEIVNNNSSMIKEREMGAIGPLMGISMKKLKGKADGKLVNKILKEEIKKLLN